ncbi:Hypothetical_protein [Hexamita inflata]|uniref:Hypothetical_protein n=1 Tax=Hexamita inflata TaxID=28002 RepID=A0AA86QEB0_9EUKA|nr:Hypothetical protein HINF_LOCUS37930 [Hexamita inflata]
MSQCSFFRSKLFRIPAMWSNEKSLREARNNQFRNLNRVKQVIFQKYYVVTVVVVLIFPNMTKSILQMCLNKITANSPSVSPLAAVLARRLFARQTRCCLCWGSPASSPGRPRCC